MRDMAYLDTRLGPEIVRPPDLLPDGAGRPPTTIDSKERILARLAVSLPPGVGIAELAYEHLERYFVVDVPEGSGACTAPTSTSSFKWAIKFDRRQAKNPVELLPELRPEPQRAHERVRRTRTRADPRRQPVHGRPRPRPCPRPSPARRRVPERRRPRPPKPRRRPWPPSGRRDRERQQGTRRPDPRRLLARLGGTLF